MVTATEIRDLWEAELREEADRLEEPEPQPWEELAYMRWHLLRTNIPVIKPDPERTWLWSDLHLARRRVSGRGRGRELQPGSERDF